jgi:Zn-finger nucleic acid-binding protein
LREHEGHLVCDNCAGMLVAQTVLAASLAEITAEAVLAVRTTGPSSVTCPRCAAAMELDALSIGGREIGGGFLRCARDGIWVPRNAFVSMYAAASARTRAEAAHNGRAYGPVVTLEDSVPRGGGGGVHSSGPPPDAQFVSVLQGNNNPFAHGGELAISHYWEHARPRVHTIFVSAFRGYRLTCTSCGDRSLEFEGDRWLCPKCGGSFVEDTALVAMISEMTTEPFELAPPGGAKSDRACPVCKESMTQDRLDGVTVARCAGHGTWFAAGALVTALEHAGTVPPKHGWLHRLFHHGS